MTKSIVYRVRWSDGITVLYDVWQMQFFTAGRYKTVHETHILSITGMYISKDQITEQTSY